MFSSKSEKTVAGTESFDHNTTTIEYSWPRQLTGVERVALSSQGGLQRVLSAFFARPITVDLVYYNTVAGFSPLPLPDLTPLTLSSASPTAPIIQNRQVHLKCHDRIVCVATSTVRMLSPRAAHLCLIDQYAIGQMFRKLGQIPAFRLIAVGFGPAPSEGKDRTSTDTPNITDAQKSKQLWRKYTLSVREYECEILEVFPTREMFTRGEHWLLGLEEPQLENISELDQKANNYDMVVWGVIIIFAMIFLMVFGLARARMQC